MAILDLSIYDRPKGPPEFSMSRDWFTGRITPQSVTPEILAEAYAAGRRGGTLKGNLRDLAIHWHVLRRENWSANLGEGADNPIVDWFMQGHRDFDADQGTDRRGGTVALDEGEAIGGRPVFRVIHALWNLEDRTLADETSVRDLIGMSKPELPAPEQKPNLLGAPISNPLIEGPTK